MLIIVHVDNYMHITWISVTIVTLKKCDNCNRNFINSPSFFPILANGCHVGLNQKRATSCLPFSRPKKRSSASR